MRPRRVLPCQGQVDAFSSRARSADSPASAASRPPVSTYSNVNLAMSAVTDRSTVYGSAIHTMRP